MTTKNKTRSTMEDRTQIKFSNPDIDGSSVPIMVVLEQDNPIEGTIVRDGQQHVYHKWLCTNMTYFMASPTLDAMLKSLPNRVGVPIKIEKVTNPSGGFPFFHVNGMDKDQIGILNEPSQEPPQHERRPQAPTPQAPPLPPVVQEVTLESINQKLDTIISLLNTDGSLNPDLPF